MEALKLFNIARSNTTNVHPPDMVDVSKLVDLVHEIAEQNIIQTRYCDDAQKLMLSIRNLMPIIRSRMDLIEDFKGPMQPQTKLTDVHSKLDDLMRGRRTALLRHWDLKYEMLELVPYWNDDAVDMMFRNRPWSSSSHRLLLRKSLRVNRDLIAGRDKKCATEVVDSLAVNSTNIQRRHMTAGTTSVRMVEASRVLDVVHDMAYQVTILYANETEAFETVSTFRNILQILQEMQRSKHPGLATELISKTTVLFYVHHKIRASSPRLWELTHELLELVPDSNDKTFDKLIQSLSWKNSCRPFDPLRLIKSRRLQKDLPEYKIQCDLYRLMSRLHIKNFSNPLFLWPMCDKMLKIYTPIANWDQPSWLFDPSNLLRESKWASIRSHRDPLLDKQVCFIYS